jgi:7,8-dihydropterin-6-yl-methyl-4-(beta-D-ribofuranosyl)aminobenzene 5'-phosphate synthase
MKKLFTTLLLMVCMAPGQTSERHRVKSLRIEVLSTMLSSGSGIGEWGFAAIVDVDGRRILFDTGGRPETALKNAKELHVDLTNIPDVILSHHHPDHTGGLLMLRKSVLKDNKPQALATIHVGKGIFYPRRDERGQVSEAMAERRVDFEGLGGRVVEYDHAVEIFPGVWLTGPVPRKHPEQNWASGIQVQTADGWKEDNIPEDMSLIFNTEGGLVLLSGCGHAGVVNTIEYVRDQIRKAPLVAAIGGFHLYDLPDDRLEWTAGKLKEFGIQNLLGAHCTGIEALYRIRQLTGLSRLTASVAAVGAVFELGKKTDPGSIAR